MDFFEAQIQAKKRIGRLCVLFSFAVAGIILAGYAVIVLGGVIATPPGTRLKLWQPGIFFAVTGCTVTFVGFASLWKWRQFSGGGAAVASSVSARRVRPDSANPQERRLLNVVEEMAIAAGVPVPAVYVLDDEPGINAFAAGLTTSDAIVCVTRGTLGKLTRDELQGVVGHEYSHILNGDMRLNVHLSAILFGILAIGLAGRGLLSSLGTSHGRPPHNSNPLFIILVGSTLLIYGYVGYCFGRLIQAAVSRQREFLADAAAVQFTRNPAGVAGALKKIGGYATGSTLLAGGSEQLGHFFFAQGFRFGLDTFFETHPPPVERIRAIDPRWDGKFFEAPQVEDMSYEVWASARPLVPQPAGCSAPARRRPVRPVALTADAGALTTGHFRRAQQLLAALPPPLLAAARDPVQAPALVCILLLSDQAELRERQLALATQHAGPEIAAALGVILATMAADENGGLATEARLPLLQLALPTLRALDRAALASLLPTLAKLIHADGKVTTFEFALKKMLVHQLGLVRTPRVRVDYNSLQGVAAEIATVLSHLARAGSCDEPAAITAFAAGAAQLKHIGRPLALLPATACTLAALDRALDKLARATPVIKQRLLVAAAQVIAADGTITVEEGELYRALAATLDVPIPLPDA